MEFIKQYWWIFAGGLALVLVMSRGKGGGTSVTQIGGDGSQLAQIDAAAAAQDQQARYGLINSLLNWDLGGRQLDASTDLSYAGLVASQNIAEINAEATSAALASQTSLAQLGYQTQASLAAQQLQAQLAAIRAQNSQQTQSNWFSLANTGLQSLLPLFLGGLGGSGSGSSGGTWQTPPIFGSGGGSWWDWL